MSVHKLYRVCIGATSSAMLKPRNSEGNDRLSVSFAAAARLSGRRMLRAASRPFEASA